MGNLGKAIAWIQFDNYCTGINPHPNMSCFDVQGPQFYKLCSESDEGKLSDVEFIIDGVIKDGTKDVNANWHCMMLAKHKTEIDNYLRIGKQSPSVGAEEPVERRNLNRIEWSPFNELDGFLSEFWQQKLKVLLEDYPDFVWETTTTNKQANVVNSSEQKTKSLTMEPNVVKVVKQGYKANDNVWGAQTNIGFASAPFYIDVVTANRESGGTELSDFILININKNDIDILCQDSKIFIADWYTRVFYKPDDKDNLIAAVPQAAGDNNIEGPTITDTGLTFDCKKSATLSLGILPCCGKLTIFSEKDHYVYKRFGKPTSQNKDDVMEAGFIDFVLKTDTVNVFVSNCSATIGISAMEFANSGKATPQIYGALGKYGTSLANQKWGIYKLSSDDSTVIDENAEDPRYYLFKGNGGELCTGVSSNKWGGTDMDASIKKLTNIHDPAYGKAEITWEKSVADSANKVMTIVMTPTDLHKSKDGVKNDTYLDPDVVLKSGTPFIYRLRGYYDGNANTIQAHMPIFTSYNVISMSHKYECQEVYSASQSVDITLYYDEAMRKSINLENRSYGVRIYMGWQREGQSPVVSTQFFTGVSLDVSVSEIAGKETITVHCEDYMRILADNVMLNSPFYDGQEWFDSIEDIATRGGIEHIKDETESNIETYYLPSGYSFQEPRMKFPQNQTLKDCITDITKLCEKVFYFNNVGELCCSDLQGGLAFSGVGMEKVPDEFKFYRDPSKADDNIILDEKKLEKLVGSTVNQIFVTSIDRETGLPLVVAHSADRNMGWSSGYKAITSGVVPPYKKILFYEQNAFGNVESAQNWIAMMAERVYKVPSRISFKTAMASIIPPLSFIRVDGLLYRTTSFTRNYNAEDNSIITNISAEWLGSPDEQK